MNRATGKSRIKPQLQKSDTVQSARTGYDAVSGRLTISPLAGGLETVESLTTAAFPVGRIVQVSGDRRIDGVPT
ncbi:MAG: hypothetical protein ACR2FS_07755 [Phormidesmis sp.]